MATSKTATKNQVKPPKISLSSIKTRLSEGFKKTTNQVSRLKKVFIRVKFALYIEITLRGIIRDFIPKLEE